MGAGAQASDLGELLRTAREDRRLSMTELARRAGVNGSYIGMIERGVRRPSAEFLSLVAKGLGTSVRPFFELAGYLPRDPEGLDVKIARHPGLTQQQKNSLITTYRVFTGR